MKLISNIKITCNIYFGLSKLLLDVNTLFWDVNIHALSVITSIFSYFQ